MLCLLISAHIRNCTNKFFQMKNYNFTTPEVKSIGRATADELYRQWQFWGILVIAIISSIALLILSGDYDLIVLTPFIIVILYVGFVEKKIRVLFWKQFAELNGWKYKSHSDINQEQGIIFRQGHSRIICHCIEGIIDERNFRIFNYNFSIGSGKHEKTYFYTVFAFKFNGTFPHIYLNNKANSYSIRAGELIPLPPEFEKSFSLSAPKEYEIEALEIFTSDVLVNLLDNKFGHDVEFVNQEMLIFSDGQISNSEQLDREFRRALDLEDLLDEKLDRFKTEIIGDMPISL